MFEHPYSFDPSYGYSLETLLAITAPEAPSDFADFWRNLYPVRRKTPPFRAGI